MITERLTATYKLPDEGTYIPYTDKVHETIKTLPDVSEKDIYRQLQEYENTNLLPKEILAMKAENERLKKLLNDFESILGGK